MPYQQEQQLHLAMRSCRYTLPDDLMFAGLVHEATTGITKIRFVRRRHETELVLPLSPEALAELIHTLGHLYGTPPTDLPNAIEEYRKQGGPVTLE